MSALTYKRTVTDNVSISGTLNEDGKTIHCVEKDDEFDVTLSDYMNAFKGREVTIKINAKCEHELELPEEDEDAMFGYEPDMNFEENNCEEE